MEDCSGKYIYTERRARHEPRLSRDTLLTPTMSYALDLVGAGGGTKRTAEEGCERLITELKYALNLDRNVSYDDLIETVKKNRLEIPYKVIVKTIGGRVKSFDNITTDVTLDDFYDMLKKDQVGGPQLILIFHRGSRLPYWIPEKEYKPDFMVPANKLPLLDVLNLNLKEIIDKTVVLNVSYRLGDLTEPQTYDEYELCPAIATVLGLRDTIIYEEYGISKENANLTVRRLREAYDEYNVDDISVKQCPLSLNLIENTTTINNTEFQTFPFPHPAVETKRPNLRQINVKTGTVDLGTLYLDRETTTEDQLFKLMGIDKESNTNFAMGITGFTPEATEIRLVHRDKSLEATRFGQRMIRTLKIDLQKQKAMILAQTPKGRCIAFYDFAYLMKWMLRKTTWPLDNEEMNEQDVMYMNKLADHFYENGNDPRKL